MKENTANRLPSLPPVGRPSGNRGASDGQKPKHTMKENQGGRGGPVRLPLVRPRNSKIQSRKETLAAVASLPPPGSFEKGQRKDDVAAEYRKKFTAQEGVLFIGKAQEKTSVFRTERRRNE